MDSYGSSLTLKVLYMLFCSPCYADMEYFINSFGMVNFAIFLISGDTRLTEYKIQLQTILMLLQLYIHLAYCETRIILLPVLRKISDHSFYIEIVKTPTQPQVNST